MKQKQQCCANAMLNKLTVYVLGKHVYVNVERHGKPR